MVNLRIVKKGVDKYWLIGVTVLFLFLGGFVIYFSYERLAGVNSCEFAGNSYSIGDIVNGYKDGYECRCENGDIVCTNVDSTVLKPTLDMFKRDGATVSRKFLIAGVNESIDQLPLKTKFSSISIKNGNMDITIEQVQKCSADLRIPIQIGMYYLAKDTLYITNVINTNPSLYTQDCVVSVNYRIGNWKNMSEDLSIVYMSEAGEEVEASLCYYNQNIYGDGDVYSSVDSCNICRCSQGVSKCSNDRLCSQTTDTVQ